LTGHRNALPPGATNVDSVAFVVGLLLVTTNLCIASAQTPQAEATSRPTFDVVSIRVNVSGDTASFVRPQTRGRFTMVNVPIVRLIRTAYPDLLTSQFIGLPSWVNSERYDIEARAAGDPTAQEIESMLRSLLADRLRLVAHIEQREQDVYELMRARTDSPGSGLRPATLDCADLVERRPASGLNLPARGSGAPPCGLLSDGRRLLSGGLTIAQLIRNIAPLIGRVIVDKTGLAGYWEFTLEYATRDGNTVGVPDSADDRPSIVAALREQLGLTLSSQRSSVDVLVIDRIERPTPN
jgi:uncharacterized protein (TIGR03435 family)